MKPCTTASCHDIVDAFYIDFEDVARAIVRTPRLQPPPTNCHLLLAVDDVDEGGLEAGTADEEAINVGLLAQVTAVLLVHAATVEDPRLVSNLVADLLLKPRANGGVHLLRLLNGGDLAGANGPDGLVSDNDARPVLDLRLERRELLADDGDGVAGLALLEALAAAPDDTEAVLGGELGLGRHDGVGLGEDGAALRVAEDGPVDVAVLELLDADLAGEGAVGLVIDVLRADLDVLPDGVADELEVDGGRGDDDLCGGARLAGEPGTSA